MIDANGQVKRAAMLALVLAAPAGAAAQPASWAEVRREPMCIYDGLVAPTGTTELDAARVGTIRSECMQRFGWTEAQGNRGFIVARLMLDMMVACREALDAGVDDGVLDSVFDSFSGDEIASMGSPGTPVSERARLVGGQLARRLVERGLARDAASKAGRAILLRMMATHMIAEFAREVMSSPAG